MNYVRRNEVGGFKRYVLELSTDLQNDWGEGSWMNRNDVKIEGPFPSRKRDRISRARKNRWNEEKKLRGLKL